MNFAKWYEMRGFTAPEQVVFYLLVWVIFTGVSLALIAALVMRAFSFGCAA